MTGLERIAAERKRQIDVEGWSPSHDEQHDNGELALAAAVYATPPTFRNRILSLCERHFDFWPWSKDAFKPNPSDRVKELAKAGALIAAEIDRLQRLRRNEIQDIEKTL